MEGGGKDRFWSTYCAFFQVEEGYVRPEATPIWRLLVDPHVACCAGALVVANVSLAFLEPTISKWMNDTMSAEEWQQVNK